MAKWLCNMPVDPSDPAKTAEWESWIIERYGKLEPHRKDWRDFLVGKEIGPPMGKPDVATDKAAYEYSAMGWVGIYDPNPVTSRVVRSVRRVKIGENSDNDD